MRNFYKYLPISDKDEAWGLQVLHAGYQEYAPGGQYPDAAHPSHHNFSWENGRVLQEYSLVYITGGSGVFNTEATGDIPITSGSVIVIFPNIRHRYRPNLQTGWKEYWIGYQGAFMSNLVDCDFFDPLYPVVNIGYNQHMIAIFDEVIEVIDQEKQAYQPLVSGAATYLLGQVYSSAKQNASGQDKLETIINKARLIMRENLESKIGPNNIADQLGISYSRFRKVFKAYTGMAPIQYQIQLKLEKAKEELVNSSHSIKEIAYMLNFDSTQYFSNLFKEKTKLTPIEFRKSFAKQQE
ncbi:AraC family transcriptional regulator [Mucilaginibacter limnophilus]|uniref:AraC family transcriptional regulator n=1 Tax=Mucilaginibacter limnophilus TaxID=1932778 RepID=A0A437MI56_9SPHI|nr:AraC family transcriptional regulator [Mucilaginibacter limnophilus]RVT97344.1 AraC family transcriptional regulator [Mucilaginibacter limnophilus]